MIKCTIEGLYAGNSQMANRNGSGTTTVADIYDLKLKKAFQIFRYEQQHQEGAMVSVPCELRFRQDGSPYFVYLAPSEALQNEADKNNSVKENK